MSKTERDAKPKRMQFSIRLTVMTVFVLASVLISTVAIGLQYYFSQALVTDAALKQYTQTAANTSDYLSGLDNNATSIASIIASYQGLIQDNWVKPETHRLFAEVMRKNPMLYAVYVGFANGDVFELVNLDASMTVRSQLQAAPQDRWVMITVQGMGQLRQRQFTYLDDNFNPRVSRQEYSDYQAFNRQWFINAREGEVSKTAPYLFQHLQAPGQTYSTVINQTDAVVAIDIALSSLSAYLQTHNRGYQEQVFVYQSGGEIIASNALEQNQALPLGEPLTLTDAQQALVADLPPLRVSNETDWPPIDFAIAGQPRGYAIDVLSLISEMTGIQFRYFNGFSWPELVDMYREDELDMLQSVFLNQNNQPLGSFSQPFLALDYGVVTLPGAVKVGHISDLNGKRVGIPKGWSIISVIREHFAEIEIVELASARQVLEYVQDAKIDAGLDSSVTLQQTARQYFMQGLMFHSGVAFEPVQVSHQLHLVMKPEQQEIIEILNLALEHITPQQRAFMQNKWFAKSGVASPSTTGAVPYQELLDIAANPAQHNRLVGAELQGRHQFIYVTPLGRSSDTSQDFYAVVVAEDAVLETILAKVEMSILITAGVLVLLIPVSWFFASPIVNPIKRLALENDKIRRRQYDDMQVAPSRIVEIHDLAKSIVDMAASIREHEQAHKELMEAFIRLIAQAIDDKSPYTAGHCARVPELGLMLAQQASNSTLPAFADFKLENDDQHRQFRIAAWLHDCGKITTPEHIVDKGAKLEIIYNRIHEVRMRFEVLWRDAEIIYLNQKLAAPELAEEAWRKLQDTRQRLQQDFAFVAACNQGGESMAEEDIERLRELATQTWTRYFDSNLGLSPLEEKQWGQDSRPLPVCEQLLADKEQHIIPRRCDQVYDPAFGIKMPIPEHLYNQGELYNLSIGRGTLTKEDRFKINEHIISTIKMLENLPFPPELAKVPRWASTHHETMKGTGYPRQLSGDELSVPERILVLADIFEALTAADRPYKKAKPVSAAIEILAKMVDDHHVDRDVFELFLQSETYLHYAQRFLPPSQCDSVDISQYLDN